VAGVEKDPETGAITALKLEEGGTLPGDFFIDATGFRKRLIVQEMGGQWVSYSKELPVNRAMPFWLDIADGEEIAPYTLAWAREAGWMWSIPTQARYGCGYVYSDAFKTPEEAKAEIEAALGHAIEPRNDIRFDIGRLDRSWIGNCLAVGLSSSFLEPLEATSIHGTVVQMLMFTGGFLRAPSEITEKQRQDYNARVARQVDDFRTFINTHYVSERDDTPFWRHVRSECIHAETAERLARWRREMPRHEHFQPFLNGLPHVEAQLHYPVLDGLGLLDPALAKAEMAKAPELRAFSRKTVDSLVKEYRQAATKALGHAEFLAAVRDNKG
jgi:tryptophan halogenase